MFTAIKSQSVFSVTFFFFGKTLWYNNSVQLFLRNWTAERLDVFSYLELACFPDFPLLWEISCLTRLPNFYFPPARLSIFFFIVLRQFFLLPTVSLPWSIFSSILFLLHFLPSLLILFLAVFKRGSYSSWSFPPFFQITPPHSSFILLSLLFSFTLFFPQSRHPSLPPYLPTSVPSFWVVMA